MKTQSTFLRLVLVSAVFPLLTVGVRAQAGGGTGRPGLAENQPGGAPLSAPEFSSWDDIKNLTHEQKAEFAIGLNRLETKLDKQIADLKDKRTKMKGENKEWDFAMRNLQDARAYLKSVGAETETSSAENWLNQKEKLGRAWQSAQDALGKVTATTTQ